VPQICNLFVLMFLLMFIFALLGMQTFGGTVRVRVRVRVRVSPNPNQP